MAHEIHEELNAVCPSVIVHHWTVKFFVSLSYDLILTLDLLTGQGQRTYERGAKVQFLETSVVYRLDRRGEYGERATGLLEYLAYNNLAILITISCPVLKFDVLRILDHD